MNPGMLLNEKAKQTPNKTALVFQGEEIDFATLNRRANRLAHALSDFGTGMGDKVGLLMPNSIEFVVAYLAVLKLGGVTVPFDIRMSKEIIQRLLDFTETSIIISSSAVKGFAANKLPILILDGDIISSGEKIIEPPSTDIGMDLPPQSEVTYLYTSGSTGDHKVVVLTLENVNCFPKIVHDLFELSDEVFGILLPMSHVTGPVAIHELVENGTKLVIFSQMRGKSILQEIEKYSVSLTWGVPPICGLLLPEARKGRFKTDSVRTMTLMGMEIPLSLMEELTRVFPSAAVVQGYGLTETTGLIMATPAKDAIRKMKSVGLPASTVEIKVVDDNGMALPAGKEGEIIIKGPMVMKGYYKNRDATEKCLKDGWLHGGDMGYLDDEGFLYCLGRKDDMIISSGSNVFPAEVEDVIRKHPGVKDVAVIGVPDEKRGEVIKAVIVSSSKIPREEISGLCRKSLPRYKCPRIIEFRSELPQTGTSKIARSALRKKG